MTDHPIYRFLDDLIDAVPRGGIINLRRWQRNPLRWIWQTYTSPSGKYVVKWRGPLIRTVYRPGGHD